MVSKFIRVFIAQEDKMNQIMQSGQNKLEIKSQRVIRYDPKTESLVEIKPMLLLDISGSMSQHVCENRKIDILRNAVKDIKNARMFVFSDDCRETAGYIPEPESSTDLVNAFGIIRLEINKDTNLLLVSDGIPDEPEESIRAAKSLGIPVNVMYIGRKGDRGEEFMWQLAKATGGKEITADTGFANFALELKSGIEQMLFLTAPEETTPTSISL